MAELVEIARAADRLGYHHLTCSEHVGIPTEVAEVRGATLLGPAGDVRLPGGCDRAGAAGDLRPGARLPPSAGDRQALRHPRPGVGRTTHPRRRRRIPARGVRAARRPVRRSRATRPTTPWSRCGPRCRRSSPRTTVPTTTTTASWSGRAPSSRGSRSGWGVAPGARSGGPWRWPTAGPRSASRRRRSRTGWPTVERPDGFEVVISPERALDPSDAASACRTRSARWPRRGRPSLRRRVVHHSLAHYLEQLEALVGLAADTPRGRCEPRQGRVLLGVRPRRIRRRRRRPRLSGLAPARPHAGAVPAPRDGPRPALGVQRCLPRRAGRSPRCVRARPPRRAVPDG